MSLLHRGSLAFVCAALTVLAACGGGDDDVPSVDAPPSTDADLTDADVDAPVDAAIDADETDADVDAMTDVDAGVDADVDAMTDIDAGVDAMPDAGIDGMMGLPGDTCQGPETVTLSGGTATVNATTAEYVNDYQPGVCAGVNSNGPDRVHVVTVPANERLTATVSPTSGTFDPGIFLIGAPAAMCDADPIVCLDASDSGGDGADDTATFDNTTASAVDVFIVIDGFRPVGDAYTLDVAVAPIPPTAEGDTCAAAEPVTLVTGMATVLATTAGFENDYEPPSSCTGYSAPGNDRVHVVSVPAGEALTATVTPTAETYDVGLYMIAGPAANCDASPMVCLAGDDSDLAGVAESAYFHNNSGAAVDVYIVIDAFSAGSGDGYMLQLTTSAALEGETCQLAPTTGPGTVTGSTDGYYNSYVPPLACTGETENGRDRAYLVNIPAGQTLTATVTPDDLYDPAIYIIAAPAAMCDANPITCLAGADDNFDGDPEVATYTNSTGSAVDVFVVVDTFYRFDLMTYTLDIAVQ